MILKNDVKCRQKDVEENRKIAEKADGLETFAKRLLFVFAGLMTERLHGQKNPKLANRFDLAARIIYPLAAVTVFVCYYFRYH